MDMQSEHTFACALSIEERAARRYGRTIKVGMGCVTVVPTIQVVSFGFAGALHDELALGTVVVAQRVVNIAGTTLWEGPPFPVHGARKITILGLDRVIDDPDEKRWLHVRTRAEAIDMESHIYGHYGVLVGCVRAISDSPKNPLGPVGKMVDPDGGVNFEGARRAVSSPLESRRAMLGILAAYRSLTQLSISN